MSGKLTNFFEVGNKSVGVPPPPPPPPRSSAYSGLVRLSRLAPDDQNLCGPPPPPMVRFGFPPMAWSETWLPRGTRGHGRKSGGGGTGGRVPPRFFRWGTEYQMSPHVLWVQLKLERFYAFFFFFFFFFAFRMRAGKGTPTNCSTQMALPQKSVGVPPPAYQLFGTCVLPSAGLYMSPPQSDSDLRPCSWYVVVPGSTLSRTSHNIHADRVIAT